MAIYHDRIEAAIKPLLARGFRVTESTETPQSFGDTRVVVTSDRLWLRFTSDRGQLFVDVAAPLLVDGWFDLSELLELEGLRAAAGPWESAKAAVDELEEHEVLIERRIGDRSLTSNLVARP